MANKKKKSSKSSHLRGIEWPPAEWPEEERKAWIAEANAFFSAWLEWACSSQPGDPFDFKGVPPPRPDQPAEVIPFPTPPRSD